MNLFFLFFFIGCGIALGFDDSLREGSRVTFQGETGTILHIDHAGYAEVDIDGYPSSWFIYLDDLDKL